MNNKRKTALKISIFSDLSSFFTYLTSDSYEKKTYVLRLLDKKEHHRRLTTKYLCKPINNLLHISFGFPPISNIIVMIICMPFAFVNTRKKVYFTWFIIYLNFDDVFAFSHRAISTVAFCERKTKKKYCALTTFHCIWNSFSLKSTIFHNK